MNIKQQRILNVLHRVQNPSLHGLSVMTGIPLTNLIWHAACLERRGYIDRMGEGVARIICPTSKTTLIKIYGGYSTLVEVVYNDPER